MVSDHIVSHFLVWKAFNSKIYRNALTLEHLNNNGNQKFIDSAYELKKEGNKYTYDECEEDKKFYFFDYENKKYLLRSDWFDKLPCRINKSKEVFLTKHDKTVYNIVQDVTWLKLTGKKSLKFKDLITVFNPIQHSNPKVWTFLKVQAIASKAKGGKYRLCSEPASGKNANDTILNMIFNDIVRVSKPTLAKLETLFYYNQKVLPDEMSSLKPTQIQDVESFFLNLADESPSFTKHSMAKRKDMNDVDIAQATCVFTYNDLDSVGDCDKFFDELWQSRKAFQDRYPAFLLKGRIISDFVKLSSLEAKQIMEENYEKLRTIALNILYYVQNMTNELHGYDRSNYKLYNRSRSNTECILDAFDVYSESQEEYNEWLDWLNQRNKDYQKMLDSKREHITDFLEVTEELIK